jgi:uncharacterized membrane protein YkvA (DUF1232 family)
MGMSLMSQDVFPPTEDEPAAATLRERLGKNLLARFYVRRRLGAPLLRAPDNLHRTARQLALGLDLIEDFRTGRYKKISWGSLALLTGAVLYSVSPGDVLPDPLVGLGSLDEAVVLALATRLVRSDLEAYCGFKGYSWHDYFPDASHSVSSRADGHLRVEPA